MILLIDNYDSFVHNLARYLRRLGQETIVRRNDALDASEVARLQPDAVVLSPGPCTPAQAGCCLDVVRTMYRSVPMLGVCLGHQVIAEAFGGEIMRAKQPVHGKASSIYHDGVGCFAGLPDAFRVGRYHSLIASSESLPDSLRITATLEDGTIMGLEHRTYPIVGWQFHPESVLTQFGYQMLSAFLRTADVGGGELSTPAFERVCETHDQPDWFRRAIEYPHG